MEKSTSTEKYMQQALTQARKAYLLGESPVGCILVRDGIVIARAFNLRQSRRDATLHAEMIVIRKACRKLKSWRLTDCDLYVTLEPCYMCAGAIIQSRIRHVYFGARDEKAGAVVSCNKLFELPHNHKVEYTGGVLEDQCGEILTGFFKELREQKKLHRE